MDINETSKYNKLLSNSDNLVIYLILFRAYSQREKLTINEIENRIQTKYAREVDRNKTWKILQTLMENEVVNKSIQLNNKEDKYYLTKVIFAPKFYTPIPSYQFLLLVLLAPITGYLYLFQINTFALHVSLISFVNVLIIMLLHYITFDILNLNYDISNLTKNKIILNVKTKTTLCKNWFFVNYRNIAGMQTWRRH